MLITDRLTLTPHTLQDFSDCAAMWAEPAVTQYLGGTPLTAEEVWSQLMRYAGLWAMLGFGYWVVRHKTSGRFVGEVGFADFRREIVPALGQAVEAGWALAGWAHGKGYAGEAAACALQWLEENLAPRPSACLIHPDNQASLRVAQKCGYRLYAQSTYKQRPTLLFGRPTIMRNC